MKTTLITIIALLAFTAAKAQTSDTVKTGSLDTTIVEKPAVLPEFSGGEEKLKKYHATHIHYPRRAKENNNQGTVLLKLLIEKDGTISDVKVIQSVTVELDNESVRVMKASPKFIPGKNALGQPVRSYYICPIKYTLISVDR
jgi:TonB family protein